MPTTSLPSDPTQTPEVPAGAGVGRGVALHDEDILHAAQEQNLINAETLAQATADAAKSQQPLLAFLVEKRLLREEDVAHIKATLLGLPYIDVFGRIVRGEILNIIPQEVAENYKMVAVNRVNDQLTVAMVDPADFKALEAMEFIARKQQVQVHYAVVSASGLRYILRQYESLSAEVEEALKSAGTEAELSEEPVAQAEQGFEEVVRHAPVSKMVSVILRHAVEGKASDVHIEPVGNESRVRYRVDGILHTSIVLPKYIHNSVVARIKVMSNLKIDETRIPQDGRFRTTIEGHDVDYRVSVLPLFNQEKVVMRILDTSSGMLTLDALGFEGRNLETLETALHKPHGMILMTGPTGSGKSTTLYAMLGILNNEEVNIITLEDPIEYYMKGVNQSQVNPEAGYSFASGLRAILRQDPDIIMVGEIRDSETAQLAVQGALTGHLILSTLHTNDAFGAVPRLIDMGMEPFLISASVSVVIAQRLVRRICTTCKTEFALPASVLVEVQESLKTLPEDVRPKGMTAKSAMTFFQGKGCARCENTGYKGRLAIVEVLAVTPDVQQIIVGGGDLLAKLKEAGVTQKMYSMQQDGILKAMRGMTTIEEIFTVTRD